MCVHMTGVFSEPGYPKQVYPNLLGREDGQYEAQEA